MRLCLVLIKHSILDRLQARIMNLVTWNVRRQKIHARDRRYLCMQIWHNLCNSHCSLELTSGSQLSSSALPYAATHSPGFSTCIAPPRRETSVLSRGYLQRYETVNLARLLGASRETVYFSVRNLRKRLTASALGDHRSQTSS